MSSNNKISEVFRLMYKDGKLLFILLATVLVTFSIFTTYTLKTGEHPLEKYLLLAVPFAFAWVVFAWAVTDKSVFRKPLIYASIFIALFIQKIYWGVFLQFYPPNDVLRLSEEWVSILDNAYHFSIIVTFFAMLVVFLIIWFLAKPKEFKKYNSKGLFLVGLSAFLMTLPLWIIRFISFINGQSLSEFVLKNLEFIDSYGFLFEAIPIAFVLIFFALVITNIKSSAKYVLYLLIFVFSIVIYLPIYKDLYWSESATVFTQFVYFLFIGVCYFIVFLSLVLICRSRYIE